MLTKLPLVFAAAGLAVSVLPSQRAVEDILPASSYACVRFAGLEELVQAAEAQGLTKLGRGIVERMDADVWNQMVGGEMERMAGAVRNGLREMGLSGADVRALLSRPVALGIGRMVFFGDRHEPAPSITLVVDAGNSTASVQRMLARLEDIVTDEMGVQVESVKHGGHSFRRFHHEEVSGEILMGMIGDHAVLSNSPGYVKECIAVAAGKQKSLAEGSTLGKVRGILPGDALLSGYANTAFLGNAIDAIDPLLPYSMVGLWDALGVRNLTGVYMGTAAYEGGSVDMMHLGLEGAPSGLFKALLSKPADLSTAKYCSPDTVLYGAMAIDVEGFHGAVERIMGMLPDAVRGEMMREMSREIGRELRHSGMSMEELKQILTNVGPSMSMALTMPPAMPIPELMLMIDVADPQVIAPYMAAMRESTRTEWKSRNQGDTTIHYTKLEMGVVLHPAYAFHGGKLLIASQYKDLRSAIKRHDAGAASLADQEDFVVASKRRAGAVGLLHSRNSKAAQIGWGAAETFLRAMLDSDEVPEGINSDLLPSTEEIVDAVGMSTVSLHVTEDGITVLQKSNMGFGTMLSLMGLAAHELLDLAVGKVY